MPIWSQVAAMRPGLSLWARSGRTPSSIVTSNQIQRFSLPSSKASSSIHVQTLRLFSKESSSSSAKDLHSQVSQTLRTPSSSTTTTTTASSSSSSPSPLLDPNAPRGVAQQIFRNPDRRARYNQALWNATAAFMLMLMAAQSLKASRERRRVAQQLADVQTQSAERLQLLQRLFDDATIDRLVQDILDVTTKDGSNHNKPSSTFLFGRSSSSSTTTTTTTSAKAARDANDHERQKLARVLLQHFDHLVGSTALDEAQRETLRMRLAENVPVDATLPQAAAASSSSEPPPKRVPFTM